MNIIIRFTYTSLFVIPPEITNNPRVMIELLRILDFLQVDRRNINLFMKYIKQHVKVSNCTEYYSSLLRCTAPPLVSLINYCKKYIINNLDDILTNHPSKWSDLQLHDICNIMINPDNNNKKTSTNKGFKLLYALEKYYSDNYPTEIIKLSHEDKCHLIDNMVKFIDWRTIPYTGANQINDDMSTINFIHNVLFKHNTPTVNEIKNDWATYWDSSNFYCRPFLYPNGIGANVYEHPELYFLYGYKPRIFSKNLRLEITHRTLNDYTRDDVKFYLRHPNDLYNINLNQIVFPKEVTSISLGHFIYYFLKTKKNKLLFNDDSDDEDENNRLESCILRLNCYTNIMSVIPSQNADESSILIRNINEINSINHDDDDITELSNKKPSDFFGKAIIFDIGNGKLLMTSEYESTQIYFIYDLYNNAWYEIVNDKDSSIKYLSQSFAVDPNTNDHYFISSNIASCYKYNASDHKWETFPYVFDMDTDHNKSETDVSKIFSIDATVDAALVFNNSTRNLYCFMSKYVPLMNECENKKSDRSYRYEMQMRDSKRRQIDLDDDLITSGFRKYFGGELFIFKYNLDNPDEGWTRISHIQRSLPIDDMKPFVYHDVESNESILCMLILASSVFQPFPFMYNFDYINNEKPKHTLLLQFKENKNGMLEMMKHRRIDIPAITMRRLFGVYNIV